MENCSRSDSRLAYQICRDSLDVIKKATLVRIKVGRYMHMKVKKKRAHHALQMKDSTDQYQTHTHIAAAKMEEVCLCMFACITHWR